MIEQKVSFGGRNLSPYILVTDVKRQVVPKRRITQTQIPGMDGALVSSVELDAMEVTVTCCIKRRLMREVSEARRALASLLSSKEPAPLVLPDEPDLYLMALYEGGAEPSALSRVPDVDLVFLCPEPVAYGRRRRATVGDRTLVSAGGTYPASPVFRAVPPACEFWRLSNATTGEHVTVEAPFDGSQEVVVDMALQRCTVNGADARVSEGSDFFRIDGEAALVVSAGEAVAEWEERWL